MGYASVLLLDNHTSFGELFLSKVQERKDMEILEIISSGQKGLEKIIEKTPDLVIMDLILPELDGIGVLEKLHQVNLLKKPHIIIASALGDDYLVRQVMRYGVDFYFVKPFEIDIMMQRICELFKRPAIAKKHEEKNLHAIFNSEDLEREHVNTKKRFPATFYDEEGKNVEIETVNLLYESGIPPHMLGYQYLKEAIVDWSSKESSQNFIVREVYQEVAKRFSTSVSKVERCVRNSIDKAWSRKNHDAVDSLLGYGGINSHNKPTNAEFIASMIERVRALRKL